MQDVTNVAADEDAVIDVRLAKLEVRIVLEMPQVLRRAGDEVVEGKHPRVTSKQRLAQVRADEARSAGYDRPRFIRGQCGVPRTPGFAEAPGRSISGPRQEEDSASVP